MGADADDAAVFEDDDAVGVHDRADALRDDDHGRPPSSLVSAARSRASVAKSSAEKLSSKMWMPPLGERPGDGEALALAAGDVGAALRDAGLELAVHLLDEVARLGDLEGLPQLVVGRLLVAVAQVAGHRAAEQERLLGHEADAVPQVVAVDTADVDAVDEHLPPVTS